MEILKQMCQQKQEQPSPNAQLTPKDSVGATDSEPASQLIPGAMGEVPGEQVEDQAPQAQTPVELPPSKYRAFVPVCGEYVPVTTAAEEQGDIDFEAEKQAIEAQFCALEKALDDGTMERSEIKKKFEILTNQAARLRRLQAAQQAKDAPSSTMKPPVRLTPVNPDIQAPVKLAPLAPPTLAPLTSAEGGAAPTMAVVHWKGVTKKKFVVYKENILEKYGSGAEGVKSIERIPNRILITVPVAAVMLQILADESLDPRPEPYRLPGGNAPPKAASGLSKPGALQANASNLLAPPDGLAPLRSPSSLSNTRAPSPFAVR